MQKLEGAGTPLVQNGSGWLRAICYSCTKDPSVDLESDDRFKERESDMTHNCYKCGEHLD